MNGRPDEHHQPGKQHLYTHAGFVLLRLALERGLGHPIGVLIEQRVAAPLGMISTVAPKPDAPGGNPLGELDAGAKSRAVQGYDEHGEPIGEPGDIQGYYLWPGTGQIFSSTRDMAVFLAANLDGVPENRTLNDALALTHRSVFRISPNNDQAFGLGDQPQPHADHREEWRDEPHLDLCRLHAEQEVRGRDPVEPRQPGSARYRTADLAGDCGGDTLRIAMDHRLGRWSIFATAAEPNPLKAMAKARMLCMTASRFARCPV